LQALAGLGGTLSGGAVAVFDPEPITKVGGAAFAVISADYYVTGMNTMLFGKPAMTATATALSGVAQDAGMDPQTADNLARGTNDAIIGLGGMKASMVASEAMAARLAAVAPSSGSVRGMDPNAVRFSQRSAGGSGRAAPLRESMKGGWNGPAVDAVETADGVVTIDNTRVAIARELGMEEIPVNVHLPSDPLPESMLGRFGDAKTWGEALAQRTGKQRPPLPFSGTPDTPRLPQ
jgi:hypothetical protein